MLKILVIGMILSVLALSLSYYPLKKSKWTLSILIPAFCLFITLAYWRFGAFAEVKKYERQQAKLALAKTMLAELSSPSDLIAKLKAKLVKTPDSARGWYLLGRLYSSQQLWREAKTAFSKAALLNPNSEKIQLNYIYSLWEDDQRHFSKHLIESLQKVLANNPNQPDALALLANSAYESHNHTLAQYYWKKLLKLVPENSNAAKDLHKSIVKSIEESKKSL